MKNFTVQSGNFTTAGNFSAYDVLGNRIFIHKRVMASKGWTKDADVKFPFFAVMTEKEINPYIDGKPSLNADGTLKMVKREQATSIFTTKEDIINAHVSVNTLDAEIKAAVEKAYSAAGLTTESVNQLADLA